MVLSVDFMKQKTFVPISITGMLVGALFAAIPALCADNKPAIRDPLEFERFSPRERLTAADRKLLEPLWKAVCERSSELKSVSESLIKRGWTNERIIEFFDSVWHEHLARVSKDPSGFGISLTEPSLEPTYPVPGGQAPAYLLPSIAKSGGLRGYSGTSIGASSTVASALLWRSQDGRVRRALENLCLLYKGYKSRCTVFKKLEKEIQDDPSNKFTHLDRMLMITTDRNNLRKQLVELVGEDTVKKLDDDLHLDMLRQ
jgi:hypothetical protein